MKVTNAGFAATVMMSCGGGDFKPGDVELSGSIHLSGVTPGQIAELAFRRVSAAAMPSRSAHA
jgi:hypothetical protein